MGEHIAEELTHWTGVIDALWTVGGGIGTMVLVLAILKWFGLLRTPKKGGLLDEKPEIKVNCPMEPAIQTLQETLRTLSRQMETLLARHEQMIEKQVEANTHLSHLVDQHNRADATGVYSRVRRQDIPTE